MPHPAIFVNIPVTSLKTAEPFYFAVGFTKTEFSSDDTTGLKWSDNIFVMLLEHPRFKSFMPDNKDLVSGRNATEALFCITVGSKEDVDKFVDIGAEKGGKKDPTKLQDMPGMYGRSVEDPDGHIWEVAFMEQMLEKKE